MIVSKSDFKNGILDIFQDAGFYGLDTETFGLRWWDNHGLYSIILSNDKESYYFNFLDTPDHLGNRAPEEYTLPRSYLEQFQGPFNNPLSTWFMHSAKFDVGMLSREGLRLAGITHCTEAIARLLNSQHYTYALSKCMERMNIHLGIEGVEKSDAVHEYIMKHKLYDVIQIPGKKKSVKDMHFDQVPFDVMAPYGVMDGVAVRSLGQYQRHQLNTTLRNKQKAIKNRPVDQDVIRLAIQERQLTPVLFRMEQAGLLVNQKYLEKAINDDLREVNKSKTIFRGYTGKEFVDSNKKFAEYFTAENVEFPLSEKGNPSFDKHVLAEMEHPLANTILDIRSRLKRVNSYYTNFKYYTSRLTGCVHPSILQGGAQTGRMSVRDPALQTVPTLKADIDDDEKDIVTAGLVRSCFIPQPDHCLFMPDYDQMEYRMMVDQAQENELIEAIQSGLDVHTATAELVGCTRKAAKTINFLLLYGGGIQKLADALGITYMESKLLRIKYFKKLRNVEKWKERVVKLTEIRGHTMNWQGRMCHLPRNFAYKAPNYEIQGGSADLVKKVMIECDKLLIPFQSTMNLQIHDELIFNLHKDELHLAPKIVDIMENSYPSTSLKLTAGPGHSWKSWGEKIDGYPIRDKVKVQGSEATQ